jgi:hypothetical protein
MQFTKLKHSLLIVIMSILLCAGTVRADEINVTGNGQASTNTVANTADQTNNVQQTNTTNVTNTIHSDANTGNNSAADNSGGTTAVSTGDSNNTTTVTSTGNTNTAASGICCPSTNNQVAITDNGSLSSNATATTNLSVNKVQVSNTATITNTIHGTVNTGNNHASQNTGGNVTVQTGTISVVEHIINGPINSNHTTTNAGSTGKFVVMIEGNGTGSINTVEEHHSSGTIIQANNTANIVNNTFWIVNTGNNNASDNANGDVTITTGSSNLLTEILNSPVNTNATTVACCKNAPAPEKPPTGSTQPSAPAPTPSTGSTSSSNVSSTSNGVGGEVLAATINKILPATGSYAFLFLLMANAMLFLLGVTLRLRAGRSPGGVASFRFVA